MTLGIALTSGSDKEEETDLFRLRASSGLSHCHVFVLCTLPAVIRNWQLVIRSLYQKPY